MKSIVYCPMVFIELDARMVAAGNIQRRNSEDYEM